MGMVALSLFNVGLLQARSRPSAGRSGSLPSSSPSSTPFRRVEAFYSLLYAFLRPFPQGEGLPPFPPHPPVLSIKLSKHIYIEELLSAAHNPPSALCSHPKPSATPLSRLMPLLLIVGDEEEPEAA